jgi:hypothetical protein
MSELKTALNNLKQEKPGYYKLYQTGIWLNQSSPSMYPIVEDYDRHLDFIEELQKVTSPDKFLALLVNCDMFEENRTFNDSDITFGDVAWGLASKYLTQM